MLYQSITTYNYILKKELVAPNHVEKSILHWKSSEAPLRKIKLFQKKNDSDQHVLEVNIGIVTAA